MLIRLYIYILYPKKFFLNLLTKCMIFPVIKIIDKQIHICLFKTSQDGESSSKVCEFALYIVPYSMFR